MSRYIDADALIRYGKCGTLVYWEDIETAPSIDIVRCRECKAYDSECEWCGGLGLGMKPDDFCSYGEAKESE